MLPTPLNRIKRLNANKSLISILALSLLFLLNAGELTLNSKSENKLNIKSSAVVKSKKPTKKPTKKAIPPITKNTETITPQVKDIDTKPVIGKIGKEYTIDIVTVTWDGAPLVKTRNEDLEQVINGNVIPYYKKSLGLDIKIGLLSKEVIKINKKFECYDNTIANQEVLLREKFYKENGLTSNWGRSLVIISPELPCDWQGLGTLTQINSPYAVLLINDNAIPNVLTHELGHNFGLGHTNLLECPSVQDINYNKCSISPYQGGVDIMSNIDTKDKLNIYDLYLLNKIAVTDILNLNKFTGESINLYPTLTDGKVQALFYHTQSENYWFEFRIDNSGSLSNGIYLYKQEDKSNSIETPKAITSKEVNLVNLGNYNYTYQTGSPSALSFLSYDGKIDMMGSIKEDENGQKYLQLTLKK